MANFATFWSCSYLLFVVCKGWHDNVSVWATARIVPGPCFLLRHYIYSQQHFARTRVGMQCLDHAVQYRLSTYLPSYQCQWMQPNQCQGCEIISMWSERDTLHHTGSIHYLFNIRFMIGRNMKTRK